MAVNAQSFQKKERSSKIETLLNLVTVALVRRTRKFTIWKDNFRWG